MNYFKAISQIDCLSNFEFIFIGTKPEVINKYIELFSIKNKCIYVPWVDSVDEYISDASLLIDIDIDAENDVYLSSKLIKYLNSDVPILSITGNNSPSRKLVSQKGLGVICVHHDFNLIKSSILSLHTIQVNLDIRLKFLSKFSVNNVLNGLMQLYSAL